MYKKSLILELNKTCYNVINLYLIYYTDISEAFIFMFFSIKKMI